MNARDRFRVDVRNQSIGLAAFLFPRVEHHNIVDGSRIIYSILVTSADTSRHWTTLANLSNLLSQITGIASITFTAPRCSARPWSPGWLLILPSIRSSARTPRKYASTRARHWFVERHIRDHTHDSSIRCWSNTGTEGSDREPAVHARASRIRTARDTANRRENILDTRRKTKRAAATTC